jgi:pimeloyl-ACP methyl ester carboxylesterase
MTDSHLLEDPQSGLSCRIAVRRIWDQDNPACERCYTIYLLPGLSGNETVRIEDPVFYSGLEKLARQYQASFVVVSVDTSAEFGTHYLTDCREGSGRLDLLTRQLVDFIDSRYPTIAEPKFRVIAGQSSGAFNALQIAMRRPGIFGTVLASAPDALDIDSWLLDESGTVKPVWRAWMRLEQAVGGAGQMLSYARCWSPVSSLDTEWPCDPGTGVTSPRVLAAWRAAGTSSLLDSEDAREALRALHGRLVIGVGRDDEFDLCLPTERFSRRLDALGIEHQLIVDDAGHFDGSSRILRLLELSKALNSDPRDIS